MRQQVKAAACLTPGWSSSNGKTSSFKNSLSACPLKSNVPRVSNARMSSSGVLEI